MQRHGQPASSSTAAPAMLLSRPLLILLAACSSLLAACSSGQKSTGSAPAGPSPRVVAFVANVSPTGEFCRLPDGCQFRLLDPRTGAEELVMPLTDIPRNVFWDAAFREVYFRHDARLFRADWRKGAEPELLLELPEAAAAQPEMIEDIWRDADTRRWRLQTLEYEGAEAIAGVWEHDPASGQWILLDSKPTECGCGDCPCAAVMNAWLKPAPRVAARDALERMGIEWHLERSRPGEQWSEAPTSFISQTFPSSSYEFQVVRGDTYHATAPVRVDTGDGNEPATVLDAGGPCGDQLAFQETDGFLLLAAEFSGACALIVHLFNGQVMATLPDSSQLAVWTNRPAP